MKKILVVFGTRPEAIKMAPVIRELRKVPQTFGTVVCITGQHREMLNQVLESFEIIPDHDLAIMSESQTLAEITQRVLTGIDRILETEFPDTILVHGDTTTSFAASLAAFYRGLSIGHVEAGLRTYDLNSPWPEEFNRRAVDLISDLYFAPTQHARDNLVREGKSPEHIFVTGNTAIDALQLTVRKAYANEHLDWASDSDLMLITAHRRENLGTPMRKMFRAIRQVIEERSHVKAIYPIHLNPQVRQIAHEELDGLDNFRFIEPLDVVDFHNFMDASHIILTDSGGIQEEAPSLGKPVLVMRNTTERPEGIEAGTLKLVGTETQTIYNAFTELLDSQEAYDAMAHASNPFGDGKAASRIVGILSRTSDQ